MGFVSALRISCAQSLASNRAWGNMGWLFSDRVLRSGLGLLVLIWMARHLGPAQFGLLNYAIAFTALLWSFTDLGLSSIVVRNLVRTPEDSAAILGTAFVLRLCATLLAGAVALLTIGWLRPGDTAMRLLVIILSTGLVFQVCDALAWWFEALVESKYVAWARSAAFLLTTLLRVFLILSDASVLAFAVANAAELALAGLGLGLVFLWRRPSRMNLHFTGKTARALLRDSWPLIFSNIAIVIYMRVDQVMLGNMQTNTELGVYSVVVLIAEAAYIVPMIVMPSLLPDIVAARQTSEPLFYERLDHLYRLMAFLGYAVALPLLLLSGWLVPFLFGPDYVAGGPMLAVLALAGIFTFMGVARTAFLVAMNWNKTHLATVFTSCLLNIALNFVLIPRYGALGAAVASLIAYAFAVYGYCLFYPPLHPTAIMLIRALLYPRFWK